VRTKCTQTQWHGHGPQSGPYGLKNIREWQVAEAVPRKVLKEYNSNPKYRRMNFSMHDNIDYLGQINFWFRTQLNSSDDKIIIDNIRIMGQKAPGILTWTPTPTNTNGPSPTITPTYTPTTNLWGCTPTPTQQ